MPWLLLGPVPRISPRSRRGFAVRVLRAPRARWLIQELQACLCLAASARQVPRQWHVIATALNTRRVQPAVYLLPCRDWLSTAVAWHYRAECRANFVFFTGMPRELRVHDMSNRLASQLAW